MHLIMNNALLNFCVPETISLWFPRTILRIFFSLQRAFKISYIKIIYGSSKNRAMGPLCCLGNCNWNINVFMILL